jgi:hypothetical protein
MSASDVASLVRRQGNRLNLLVQSTADFGRSQEYGSFPNHQYSNSYQQQLPPNYATYRDGYSSNQQQQSSHIQPMYASTTNAAPPQHSNHYTINPHNYSSNNVVRIRNAGAPLRVQNHTRSSAGNTLNQDKYASYSPSSPKAFPVSGGGALHENRFFQDSYPSAHEGVGKTSRNQLLSTNYMDDSNYGVQEAPFHPVSRSAQQQHIPTTPSHARAVSSISLGHGAHVSSNTFPRRGATGQQKTPTQSRRWDQWETAVKVQNWFQQSSPTVAPVEGDKLDEEQYVHVPVKSRVGNFEAITAQQRPATSIGAVITSPRRTTLSVGPQIYNKTTSGNFSRGNVNMAPKKFTNTPVSHVNASQAEEVLHIDPRTRGEFGEVTENYTDF